MNASRILIVAVNWLGDLIFLTPAIRAIRRQYPRAYLACLTPPRGVDLLKGNPHLDAVIPLSSRRGLFGLISLWPLARRLETERFDTAFLFHRSFSRTVLAWAAGIRSRIGYRTWKRGWLLTQAVDPPPQDSVHKAAGFLLLLEKVGIATDGLRYEVGLLPEDAQAAERLLKEWQITPADRWVALHPGANWHLKRWPLHRFAELADCLQTRYRTRVLLIGDQGDLPLVQAMVKRMKTPPLVATGKTTFRQLGALLRRAALLISNDSGPLHLGQAVGTPTVALFGPTDPRLSGPQDGERSMTLFGSIGCPVPCYQLRCPVNLCMGEITVEQVLSAASRFLNQGGQVSPLT